MVQDYLILRGHDLTEDEAKSVLPTAQLVANLERWLSSVFSRRLLHEMYEVSSGTRIDGLRLHAPATREQIRRGLSDAFRNKVLVALPNGPLRVKSGAAPGPAASKAQVVVPLLPDKPTARPAKPPAVESPKPPKTQVDAAAQAQALREAANSGAPFCEKCEKAPTATPSGARK